MGVLPNLVQLRTIVPFQGAKFLFRRPRYRNNYEILEYINLSGDTVAFYDGGHITSDYLMNTRITPCHLTFLDSVKLFRRVQLVIGVHSGAFYNIIFAPSSTNFVEIMPTTSECEVMPTYIGHTLFWVISDMLNQTYWRIISTPADSLGNVKCDIREIEKVFDKIDRR